MLKNNIRLSSRTWSFDNNPKVSQQIISLTVWHVVAKRLDVCGTTDGAH
jgi:hypothetical protein